MTRQAILPPAVYEVVVRGYIRQMLTAGCRRRRVIRIIAEASQLTRDEVVRLVDEEIATRPAPTPGASSEDDAT